MPRTPTRATVISCAAACAPSHQSLREVGSSQPPALSLGNGLEVVEPARVVLENLALGRVRDILARQQLAGGVGLAVAVRHVRAEQDVLRADQLDRLRQQRVLDLAANVD